MRQLSWNAFPVELLNLVEKLQNKNLNLILVGGAVRDFYLNGVFSDDFDFEIRSLGLNLSGEEWVDSLRNIFQEFQAEELPYGIFRLQINSFSFEFASPRLEIENGQKSHHHFEASLNSQLNFDQASKRRDFTINAIGVEFDVSNKTLIIHDPCNGLSDIKQKKLRPISKDFELDPVRFLRAIRFKLKLGFEYSEELIVLLQKMNLSQLTFHYIELEAKKVGFKVFFEEYHRIVFQLSLRDVFLLWKSDPKGLIECNQFDQLVFQLLYKNCELVESDLLFKGISKNKFLKLRSFANVMRFELALFEKDNFFESLKREQQTSPYFDLVKKCREFRPLFINYKMYFESDLVEKFEFLSPIKLFGEEDFQRFLKTEDHEIAERWRLQLFYHYMADQRARV